MGTVSEMSSCTYFLLFFKFAVVKFLATPGYDDEFMEVALASWIVDGAENLTDHMMGQIYWPPESRNVTSLIKTQHAYDKSWRKFPIQVLRFYDTFVRARQAVPKFLIDSTYETEPESSMPVGRGKRNRIKPAFLQSSDDDDEIVPLKKPRQAVPPPPPIAAKLGSTKVRKGQGSLQGTKKKEREEVMARLKTARAVAASKMTRSPLKSPLKSNWKVTPMKAQARLEDQEQVTPGSLLSVEINEDDPDVMVTPPVSPSPDVGSPSTLMRTTSFYLPVHCSPVSAAGTEPSPLEPVTSSGKGTSSGDTSAFGRSRTQGCRNLFPEEKSEDDKWKTLQISVSRLNIVTHEISQKLDLMLMNLSRLQRSVAPNEKRLTVPPNMPKLPLEDESQLKNFETFLGESDLNLAAVCDYMASYVRSSVPEPERESATNILTKMLTNNLAKEINLEGGNKKIAFRTLNMYKVFQGTLQSAFQSSDLSVAEDALKKWLKDAKWRKQRVPAGA